MTLTSLTLQRAAVSLLPARQLDCILKVDSGPLTWFAYTSSGAQRADAEEGGGSHGATKRVRPVSDGSDGIP